MLKHACIALALLIGLGGAAQAQYGCGASADFATLTEGGKIQEYTRLLDCAKREIDSARARLDELELGRMDTLAETLINQRDGLNSLLAERHQRIRELESEVQSAKDANEELAAEKDREIAEKDRQLAELQAQLAVLQTQISELQARVDILSKERDRLTGNNEGLAASLKEAQDEIAVLKADLDAAEKANADLAAQLEAARKENSDLSMQLDAARTTNNGLTGELDAAGKSNADLGAQLGAANSRIAELQCRLDRLSTQRSDFFTALKAVVGDNADVSVTGDRFIIQSEVWFDSGSADLKKEVKEQLVEIAALVRDLEGKIPATVPWVLQINGHTDLQKFKKSPRFPRNNWELSVARALSVIDLMEKNGVSGNRLAAAGLGEYQPMDPGRTAEAFRKNRRIELKLTDDGTGIAETGEAPEAADDCAEQLIGMK